MVPYLSIDEAALLISTDVHSSSVLNMFGNRLVHCPISTLREAERTYFAVAPPLLRISCSYKNGWIDASSCYSYRAMSVIQLW